ncbi:MAG TPA: GNAT family N-acetyltransferase [Burkholderiales bacterium]|nr:GNAT family N-acetyltransferase [Burkholderiales bacterium]
MEARSFRVEDRLRDGTAIVIRAVRSDDHDRMLEAYGRLSPEAIYLRVFAPKKELTEAELKKLVEVDFEREVALVATIGSGPQEAVIGGGRYVRTGEKRNAAEVAFTVDSRYRGQGIASLLLGHLAAIARGHGIARFEAEVLAENRPMLSVFTRAGLPMERRREGGVVHVELTL